MPDVCEFLENVFMEENVVINPFLGMESKWQQDNFFRDVMGVVEPKQNVLRITHVQQRIGVGRRTVPKQDEVIEISLLKSLEQMLQDPAILHQVLLPLPVAITCCHKKQCCYTCFKHPTKRKSV
ncbi:uncharacterized protein LOC124443385 [Xenia sp. Carnegie-2017]|uniref:uncharacterized protein LOC124443385 n=1 Tax=Xenia sp. Carnegie-2017 TaxID=2897299 RepID=UPI001F040E9E|nr:uncharacterized protein LOC124443385 [Xenia sp. Carnegie-2017]